MIFARSTFAVGILAVRTSGKGDDPAVDIFKMFFVNQSYQRSTLRPLFSKKQPYKLLDTLDIFYCVTGYKIIQSLMIKGFSDSLSVIAK